MIIQERSRCVNPSSRDALRAAPTINPASPMLVSGPAYSTLWVPVPGDVEGHCEVHRCYRQPSNPRWSVQFKLWRPGKTVHKVQKDQGGIVTCTCQTYSRDGECPHTDAAIEVGLV